MTMKKFTSIIEFVEQIFPSFQTKTADKPFTLCFYLKQFCIFPPHQIRFYQSDRLKLYNPETELFNDLKV